MSLSLQDKQTVVAEVNRITKNALSVIVADSRGISVNKITELRKKGRENNVYIRVVRNTLLKRAINDTSFKCLKETLIGPSMIAYSMKHPGAAARLFKEFAKTNVEFKISSAVFEGKLILASQIDRLANLPTLKEAILHLILILKDVSAGKLIKTLVVVRNKKNICT